MGTRLLLYIPVERWDAIVPLLPQGYTLYHASGVWQGQAEQVNVVEVYSRDSAELELLGAAVSIELRRQGEVAVLYSMQPVNYRLN